MSVTSGLRVLMVTAAYPPVTGGVPMHTSLLTDHLRAAGVDVEVATQTVDGQVPAPGSDRAPVRRFPGVFSGFNTQSPRLWAWLAARSGRYDVVHVHNYHSLLFLPAALLARTAVVATPHYHGTGHSPARALIHPLYRPLGARAFQRASAVICVSQPEAELVRTHFPAAAPITVIPNGVDAAAIWAAPPASRPVPYVLTAGRMERYKRFDQVIDALAGIPGPLQLVIVGDGPERQRLEEHAARRGVEERVAFLGRVDDPTLHGLLRGAELVVTASTEEAFGMIVAEGLVAAQRLVVSDIPAHRYVATLHPGGADAVAFVAPGDEDPSAFRTAMQSQLSRPRMPAPLVLPSWGDVADQTVAVYRSADLRRRAAQLR